ncbi:MAG: hypothetical protein AAF741_17695 [Bacteroidota bacterium]
MIRLLLFYLLLSFSTLAYAQDIQTASRIYPDQPELGTAGLELYENDTAYITLVADSTIHFIDKISLDRVGILDLSPFQASTRTGHALLVTDSTFYLAIRSPFIGLVEFNYEGEPRDSFIVVDVPLNCDLLQGQEAFLSIWENGENELALAVSFERCIDTRIFFLNEFLESNDVTNIDFTNVPFGISFSDFFVPIHFERRSQDSYWLGLLGSVIICFGFDCGNFTQVLYALYNVDGTLINAYLSDGIDMCTFGLHDFRIQPDASGNIFLTVDQINVIGQNQHRLIYVDSTLTQVWRREIEREDFEHFARGLTIDEAGNAIGVVGFGTEEPFVDGPFPRFDANRSILYKFSPQGDSIWQRTLLDSNYLFPNGESRQELRDVIVDEDGAIVLIGSIELPEDTSQLWLIRLNEDGCLTDSCTEFMINSVDDLPLALRGAYVPRLQVYPNPAPQQFTVDWPKGIAEVGRLEPGMLRLIDLQGRVVAEQDRVRLPYEWQVGDVPTGQYLLEWLGEDGSLAKGKVILK